MSSAISLASPQNLTAPIHTVPPEILRSIFIECVALDWDEHYSILLHKSPWLLTRICRQWRELAITQSALWRTIRFCPTVEEALGLTSREGVRWETCMELLCLQFARSQIQPLVISIQPEHAEFSCQWERRYPGFKDRLSQLLAASHTHWESLHFSASQELITNIKSYMPPPPYHFPVLRHLEGIPSSLFDKPYSATMLKHILLRAKDHDHGECTCPYIIPWSQVNTLVLSSPCASFFAYHRHNFQNITSLHTRNMTHGLHSLEEFPESQACLFPQLKFISSEYGSETFRTITAPALKSLSLQFYETAGGKPDGPCFRLIDRFLRRSACSLRSFSCDQFIPIQDLLAFLGNMDELQYLQLAFETVRADEHSREVTETLLTVDQRETLSEAADNDAGDADAVSFEYWPRLHHLSFKWLSVENRYPKKVDMSSILDVYERRRPTLREGELREEVVLWMGPETVSVLEGYKDRIHRLGEMGMEFFILRNTDGVQGTEGVVRNA